MIGTLNALIDMVDAGDPGQEIDVASFSHEHGTTEYHLRRMFSALAGMPFSEYVRRRRMTLAGAELAAGAASLLDVAVRHGYGSVEAFGRAFRAVHGISPADARRDGGPLRTQPTLRFRLSVEGRIPMDVTITTRPAFVLAGHAAEVPLIHEGVNPHIQEHIAAIPSEEHARLKGLGDAEPSGILAVTADIEPDAPEGTLLTYLHGVALQSTTPVPDDLDSLPLEAGSWAVFAAQGPFPETLQDLWAATATEWFPSNPWRLRPGPSIVRYLEFRGDSASCELWLPVEHG
ncbi:MULTISPECIES: AraC family transcriptional regulator [unclassified Microbacterium]|uniref:AraC family transcriptional regulator n=1 Tax=unclassified Microbacterium TaxID=2609290 RepID=UPI00109BA597|nr:MULTISPECIES: GyrI-like domain-containing protein [unclassified Microbacterium]MCV0335362.1 GyrI-like domain-containing protein [Microbacterium sp.]MCV0375900.1 GyrI-like domain-containing protein [Microbacterium sp.]MCV0390156.1 GyrI-like domain-containing protein [Microbacterium sp.]MCV0417891.1 GyrI-like domain-containing protein [Microbacterium sp.]MCV0422441.1 GyrI-like domain-containing protein [Microbacterium sp.]